jgi:hypothetical protein
MRKLPTLKIDYNGNYRLGSLNKQLMNTVAVISGYNYKVAKTNMRTLINYQLVLSNADSVSFSDYTLHNVMLTQSVSFRFPVTLLANIGFNQMKNILQTTRQIQFGTGVFSTPFKNFSTGVNMDMAKNLGREYRLGTTLDVSYFFLKHFTVSTNFRFNRYQSYFSTDFPFNEIVLTTRLMIVW